MIVLLDMGGQFGDRAVFPANDFIVAVGLGDDLLLDNSDIKTSLVTGLG